MEEKNVLLISQKLTNQLCNRQLVGLYGMVFPFISMGLIGFSIFVNAHWFVLTENLLSDLGHYSKIGPISCVFNFTLMILGILLIIFSLGFISVLDKEFENPVRFITTLGGGCLTWMGVMAIIAGIFTRDTETFHAPASFFLFSCLASSIGLVSLGMFLEKEWRLFAAPGVVVYMIFIALFFIALFAYFIFGKGLNVAVMQLFGGASFYLWIFLHSYRVYKTEPHQKSQLVPKDLPPTEVPS